jgi:hypothetical protein
MSLFEGKTTAERNKTIAALALGVIALFFIVRMFFGSSDETTTNTNTRRTTNTNTRTATTATTANALATDAPDPSLIVPQPIDYRPITPGVPSVGRNIFAYYVRPPAPVKKLPDAPMLPPATPVPTPPLLVASVSPANVFARTAEFDLEVAGDKFTPDSRVFVEGQELPTTFKSAQALAAKVPAALITAQGARTVEVKTPDNRLYSNTATFNVMPAPTPQFTFIGVLGAPGYARDKAILKPTQSNDLRTVQRNDVVDGRFKVINISERAVEFLDTQLNIKHSVPFTDAKTAGNPSNPSPRGIQPPQKSDDDDDDPQD